MINGEIFEKVRGIFRDHFSREHAVVAYAPGRVEVLGNHTDYNEGFVLSAAIDLGTFFLAAPRADGECRLVAADVMEETRFDVTAPGRSEEHGWSNYVRGVLAGLAGRGPVPNGFDGMFLGNIPLGAGLSSSAALEMSAGLALAALYGTSVDQHRLAEIGQAAEHEYAGVKCGLLDQITSLYGEQDALVLTDFRSLEVETVPFGHDACLLMCNTKAHHALVDGEYNERRASCENAAAYFADTLDRPVTHLRDVHWNELQEHKRNMEPVAAKRALHIVGENRRVHEGRTHLRGNNLEGFGVLMFESHESSRHNFENSCPELDTLVALAQGTPGVLGARLSGGGFGGSVVALVRTAAVDGASRSLAGGYAEAHGHPCDIRVLTPSAGATVLE